MKNDLVDEFRLAIYPLTLGQGKKLFAEGTIPAAFTLTESAVTPNGVITANYRRSGEVKKGHRWRMKRMGYPALVPDGRMAHPLPLSFRTHTDF